MNFVKDAFVRIRSSAEAENLFQLCETPDNNQAARAASDNFYAESASLRLGNFHGANETENPVIAEAGNQKFVLPGKSSFYAYDVRQIAEKLYPNQRYDFILMDPPWWNKFVRRKKDNFVECR